MYKITEFCNDTFNIENTTICKHKSGSCEICGTNNETDVIHTTKNGVGKVGVLFKETRKLRRKHR